MLSEMVTATKVAVILMQAEFIVFILNVNDCWLLAIILSLASIFQAYYLVGFLS